MGKWSTRLTGKGFPPPPGPRPAPLPPPRLLLRRLELRSKLLPLVPLARKPVARSLRATKVVRQRRHLGVRAEHRQRAGLDLPRPRLFTAGGVKRRSSQRAGLVLSRPSPQPDAPPRREHSRARRSPPRPRHGSPAAPPPSPPPLQQASPAQPRARRCAPPPRRAPHEAPPPLHGRTTRRRSRQRGAPESRFNGAASESLRRFVGCLGKGCSLSLALRPSASLSTSPHISPHLPTSPHISP